MRRFRHILSSYSIIDTTFHILNDAFSAITWASSVVNKLVTVFSAEICRNKEAASEFEAKGENEEVEVYCKVFLMHELKTLYLPTLLSYTT